MFVHFGERDCPHKGDIKSFRGSSSPAINKKKISSVTVKVLKKLVMRAGTLNVICKW